MKKNKTIVRDKLARKIGGRIRTRRREKGWSQMILATNIEVTEPTLSRWERGDRLPSIQDLMALCEELGCSIWEILGDERATKEENDWAINVELKKFDTEEKKAVARILGAIAAIKGR